VTDWLKAKFGRMRVSTLVLVVAFLALFWVHQAFQPEPSATEAPPTAVVPPGFVPDPDYTWVPRTNVREQPRMTTTTTTPPTTTTTTTTSPTETTSPTSPTQTPMTTVIDPDGPGPLAPLTQTVTPTPTTTAPVPVPFLPGAALPGLGPTPTTITTPPS
jgi:cytoskeletal protein RodZ